MASSDVRSQDWIDKIEELVRRTESISDPNAHAIAVDLLQAVLDFHAAGLNRIMELIVESGDSGVATQTIIEGIATDELVSAMLLVHDLHPDDVETRVNRAVQKLQEVFASLGARLSLIAIEGRTVRLHFDSARAWSEAPVKTSVENAIFQAAPEMEAVVMEGLKETPPANFVPVSDLLTGLRV